MNLRVFVLLLLVFSSSFTYPVLAAEELGTASYGSTGVIGWLYTLIAGLVGWEIEEPPVVEVAAPEAEGDGSSSSLLIKSVKDLELATLDYAEDMHEINKAGFLLATDSFLTTYEDFVSSLDDSAVESELQEKLQSFSDEVLIVKEKAERGSLTKEDLDSLVNHISSATGRRYEKVDFEKYVEREIHPRILGAGGEVFVASGQLALPPSVESAMPLPEDYLPEEQIAPEIQDLANTLDNDPAKIYWWVRENVRYEPYYGAMQGAEQTLTSRYGNDIDTSLLLTALLRASGYPTRYVYGKAHATREEVFDLLGVNDVSSALRLMWGAGIPSEFDGKGFLLERMWVETYAKPSPYLSEHWVQLDSSWKKAGKYTKIDQYVSVQSTVNAAELAEGALSGAEINETEGYVTGINTSFIDGYLDENVETTLLQNISQDFFVPEEKMPASDVLLPLSMQFDFDKSYEYSSLPDALKYRVTLDLSSGDGNLLHYENFLPRMSGKSFVLDFSPATSADEEKIQAGDPAYEIMVTPRLYLGNDYAPGNDTMYGGELNITLEINLVESLETKKKIYAVERTAVVLDSPKTDFTSYNQALKNVKQLQDINNNDSLAREGLYLLGLNFFLRSDYYTDGLADFSGLRWVRANPGIAFITKERNVQNFGDAPISVEGGGTSIDLKYDHVSLSSDKNDTIDFNLQRGFTVSGFEGTVLEEIYNVTSISTLTIFNKAITENIPIHIITKDTLDKLNLLDISSSDKNIIRELLNKSSLYYALVPENNSQIGNWHGNGYIIIDIETGAGKYLIYGGLAGGITSDIKACDMAFSRLLVSAAVTVSFLKLVKGAVLICNALGIFCRVDRLIPVAGELLQSQIQEDALVLISDCDEFWNR